MRSRPTWLIGFCALAVAACSSGSGHTAAPPSSRPTSTARPAAATCASAKPALSGRIELTSGGVRRWYLLHVPRAYSPTTPMPLVIDLHGYMVGATGETAVTGLERYGETHDYLTVTPQGSGPAALVTWDTDPDSLDVRFFGDLLDHLERTLCVDTRRVFVTGYSQGAFMTSTLACVYADRIAAVATIAGPRDAPGCHPTRPVPVVAFHGTADPDIGYRGGLGPGGLGLQAPDGSGRTMGEEGLQHRPPLDGAAIPVIAAAWARRASCETAPRTARIARDVSTFTWRCPDDHAVELYRIDGGGHTWPGSPFTAAAASILGPTTMSISANEIMWRFFTAHPLRER